MPSTASQEKPRPSQPVPHFQSLPPAPSKCLRDCIPRFVGIGFPELMFVGFAQHRGYVSWIKIPKPNLLFVAAPASMPLLSPPEPLLPNLLVLFVRLAEFEHRVGVALIGRRPQLPHLIRGHGRSARRGATHGQHAQTRRQQGRDKKSFQTLSNAHIHGAHCSSSQF